MDKPGQTVGGDFDHLSDLLARYRQQAAWTAQIRANLLGQVPRQPGDSLLEVGCGPGAVTATLREYGQNTFGLDIHLPSLLMATRIDPRSHFCQGDALALPYAQDTFQVVVCHFLLLWIADLRAALCEMSRVAKHGGAVIAFAEPDYGGRIDYPPPLDELGRMQAEALRRQGANTNAGRMLTEVFHTTGLEQIQTGLLGGQWNAPPDPAAWDDEWRTIERDLSGIVSAARLSAWQEADRTAWQEGSRVLFVPTFYAIGWKTAG